MLSRPSIQFSSAPRLILASLAGGFLLSLSFPLIGEDDPFAKMRDERKVALVIGIGTYADSPLRNTLNDAREMKRTLDRLGFEVIHLADSELAEMENGLAEFRKRLEGADIGLFYFSGHGLQLGGINYLVPVAFGKIRSTPDLDREFLNARRVAQLFNETDNEVNILIIDACREYLPPLEEDRGSGLAAMESGANTLLAFATAPGQYASDGTRKNGLYTERLLTHMQSDALPIETIFKRVRVDVMQESGEDQIPWEHSSLTRDFFFILPEKDKQEGFLSQWQATGFYRDPTPVSDKMAGEFHIRHGGTMGSAGFQLQNDDGRFTLTFSASRGTPIAITEFDLNPRTGELAFSLRTTVFGQPSSSTYSLILVGDDHYAGDLTQSPSGVKSKVRFSRRKP